MYGVGKPELTYDGNANTYILTLPVRVPLGTFIGAAFYDNDRTDNPDGYGDSDAMYKRAYENAWSLIRDAEQHADAVPPTYVTMHPIGVYDGPLPVPTLGRDVPVKVLSKPKDKVLNLTSYEVPASSLCMDCKGDITSYVSGTAVLPATEVMAMTLARWKRPLCASCSAAAVKRP